MRINSPTAVQRSSRSSVLCLEARASSEQQRVEISQLRTSVDECLAVRIIQRVNSVDIFSIMCFWKKTKTMKFGFGFRSTNSSSGGSTSSGLMTGYNPHQRGRSSKRIDDRPFPPQLEEHPYFNYFPVAQQNYYTRCYSRRRSPPALSSSSFSSLVSLPAFSPPHHHHRLVSFSFLPCSLSKEHATW